MHPADQSPLGKTSEYSGIYTPSLLYPIPRQPIWEGLGLDPERLPFNGADVWNSYEVSWLTPSGKPDVAAVEFVFPLTPGARIVESKSFKLYLNSLNQTVFSDRAELLRTMESDLSVTAQAPVMVRLMDMHRLQLLGIARLPGESLDGMDVDIDTYEYDPGLLKLAARGGLVRETLNSNLLKSNCPVTGQPDWASVMISYAGPALDRASVLRYLVSFRQHADFHEQCVERIFLDLHRVLGEGCELSVYARYLRRGGLDINPWRSTQPGMPDNLRLARQ
ncbi:NADPH-dependent 7-cyano-7-deazaguanine reductase QueF [Halopseudomonas pertucinogena]|uniref:NADPH-dependent 7-cyano-7-deazaguanine reductase n=1 Tax=Halopseudomonas pertucinogena TaxID=86175 RepID=A0ABQ2CNA2_9GAMM|nr:NADPH-dependent 7-cyano-7-deazaguanine reductase QueF [Halopseudomonas pertucinogena]GGI97176.1 NADPH-dependent 7-cyano-7-deazaguanine reductase [Halopseudomonas pertucinogena]